MRNHTEESPNGINGDVHQFEDNRKSARNRPHNFQEDQFRGSRQESGTEYHRDARDSLLNLEDQVETSKLVLQLVTDSRFNMTQINGQRKLGGPPPGWNGPAPGPGCEVFVGKIPRTLYEHEIYPIFRRMGEVYEIRLMMDFSGTNRGYCFVMFGKPEFAERAIQELDNFEIRPGRRIGVVASINNCRLYIGQLPQDVNSETVIRKIYEITDDVGQVSVYRNANDQARYALISYRTHRGAAMARRRLVPDRASLFGGGEVSIDWAHPSMLPSNVVEDTGTCDDDGNIEISRLVVGNENKRYQNRRRIRDDFLEHSIRAYLQTDRGSDHPSSRGKQNLSKNQSFGNALGSVTRGINGIHMYDQNANSRSQNYVQRHNSRPDKNRRKLEIPRKLRDSNSSFDLNPGSGESESSGCSSQSSASERHHSLSKEFPDQSPSDFYSSQIFYTVDNEREIFNDEPKIGGKLLPNRSNESGGKKCGKKDADSLNLFDNYTFSVNCRDPEDRGDFKDVGNSGDDISSANFERNSTDNEAGKIFNGEERFASSYDRGGNFSPKIRNDSETKREPKNARDMQRCKNFLNKENNNVGENSINGFNAFHKSTKYNPKSQNFGDLANFTKTVGAPVKNELFKPQGGSNPPNFLRHQNRNGIGRSLPWNKNCKISTASLLVAENLLMQQQQLANSSNARSLSHSMNPGGKRAWPSAQYASNGYDFSSNNLGSNSANSSAVYSGSDFSGELQQSAHRISAPCLMPRANSPVMNFYPGHGFSNHSQNGSCQSAKRQSSGRNVPKNGRPILSRSYASLCNEN